MDYTSVDRLIASGHTISVMESCTGGLIAAILTDRSGASEIFPGGFVTYSNRAKIMQGVPAGIIDRYGVYSGETAEAMAHACAAAYGTEIGVGVTGSLGRKDPANPDSISGRVHYCILYQGKAVRDMLVIPGEITERREMKQLVAERIIKEIVTLVC